MATTKVKRNATGAAIALAIAGMASLATPIFQDHEGNILKVYKDPIGIATACSGATGGYLIPGKKYYTQEECNKVTANILIDFGTEVAKANPDIIDYKYEWAAHTIFAANVGKGAYAKSSVKRLYEKGTHRNACRFLRNYKYAGGRVFQGLVNRREGTNEKIGEYELCLVDAVRRDLNEK